MLCLPSARVNGPRLSIINAMALRGSFISPALTLHWQQQTPRISKTQSKVQGAFHKARGHAGEKRNHSPKVSRATAGFEAQSMILSARSVR